MEFNLVTLPFRTLMKQFQGFVFSSEPVNFNKLTVLFLGFVGLSLISVFKLF